MYVCFDEFSNTQFSSIIDGLFEMFLMKCKLYLFSSIAGGELFDRVIEDEFVLTEKACVCFMKQILDGVTFMHSKQILHLDLKVDIFRLIQGLIFRQDQIF